MNVSDADSIKTFLELGSPFIADGMQQLGLPRRIADPALRPLIPDKRLAGTVVTLCLDYYPTEPTPHPYIFNAAFEQAAQVTRPILVTESRLGLRSPFGGGVRVLPGDLVVADEDGIVFCAAADAAAVIEAARAIETEEKQIFARWDAGDGYLKGLGLEPGDNL